MHTIPKVLIVATSRKTRGGITSVIKAYENNDIWNKFQIHWIQTHRDGSYLIKILYLTGAVFDFLFHIPFYDIVHIHISDEITLIRKCFFLCTSRLLGKKVIVHYHFNIEHIIDGKMQYLYKLYFKEADYVLVLAKCCREQIITRFGSLCDKVNVLYNPCSNAVLPDIHVCKDKSILFAGTICSRKGYADLIKAFAIVLPNHPEWKLILAGNGEIEEGKKLAEKLGIGSSVQFPGWLTGKDKDEAYQRASVFCLPSYSEGFPMSVLEAWTWGLPVVTTPIGGIPDVAKDGENILLFTPGNIKELASKLELILSDESLRDKIGIASLNLAKHEFNAKTICEQLSDVYSKIVQ